MKNFISNLFRTEPFTLIKGVLVFLIGPLSLQLAYLLIVIGIDLFFGIQVARKKKQFSWKTLYVKARHKIVIYSMIISMFHAFDMVTGLPETARYAVLVMLCGMEMLSAIKNTAKLGHNTLATALEQMYFSLIKVKSPTETEKKSEEGGNQDELEKSESEKT